MYVDSVYVKHFQEVAQLISPMTTAPMSGCLSFYYQLQQGNDNSFSLYTRDGAGLYEELWKMDQPESAAWNVAEVEFSAPYPMEVGVEGGGPWLDHCARGRDAARRLTGRSGDAGPHAFVLLCCVSILILPSSPWAPSVLPSSSLSP